MERKLYQKLVEWKARHDGALILRGPRQVGKSYLLAEFSKEYSSSLIINLEDEPAMSRIFEKSRNPDEIYTALSVAKGFSTGSEGERPLLVIDEIQASEAVFSALKPLAADGRCDVIASGSLLGILLNGKMTSPMGYAGFMDMGPMDFEEFLWALGTEKSATGKIRSMIASGEVPDSVRGILDDLFSKYMMVGGMPAAVKAFAETRDYGEVRRILAGIVEFARGDVIKYAPNVLKLRILACFDAIPRILGKEKKILRYADIESRPGYGSREYDPAIEWLVEAGIVIRCRNVSSPSEPLSQNERADSFKIYLLDQGILTYIYGLETAAAIAAGGRFVNRGAVVENAVASALRSSGYSIHFYAKRDSTLETDFLIRYRGKVTAIEVKSGASKRSKSLKMLLSGDYHIDSGIKLSDSPCGRDENGVLHLPLFAPAFFEAPDGIAVGWTDAELLNEELRLE